MQNKQNILAVLLCLTGLVTLVSSLQTTGRAQDSVPQECLGLPYGSPGCPVRPGSSAVSSARSKPPHCGDNLLQETEGEQCDLGRFNGLSSCSTMCTALFCGDSTITPYLGEECEPPVQEVYILDPKTNLLTTKLQYMESACGRTCAVPTCDEEGLCESGCQWKFKAACPSSASVSSLTVPPQTSSGDTALSASSSSAAGLIDGASESSVSSPFSSEMLHPADATSSASTPLCGNDKVETGEECDDGNQVEEDSCTNQCTRPRCGDGFVQQNEECDDGNRVNDDVCDNTCKSTRCGDGIVQTGEECDDGNRNNLDDCPNDCALSVCGDGILEGREQCDDGNFNNWDPCPNICRLPVCGNGIREGTEECDDGNRNDTDTCSLSCTLPQCGDGVMQRGEECDDGNQVNDDTCTNGCQKARCGDAIVQAGEECDDGNRIPDDLCNNSCLRARC
ncbi:MAG: DUF4215 domain-containing protein, partial [Candidatus Peribacteraceae bacterium]|nr:DUF4215 domain-containing protein [Candidatus Peribacteraceae bacterium]